MLGVFAERREVRLLVLLGALYLERAAARAADHLDDRQRERGAPVAFAVEACPDDALRIDDCHAGRKRRRRAR